MAHLRPRVVVATLLTAALLIAGFVLAVRGLPDRTAAQSSMLDYSQILFAAAVLVTIAMTIWERRAWRGRGFRIATVLAGAFFVVAAVALIGDRLLGWAWVADEMPQALAWCGLAVLSVWIAVDVFRQDRRLRRRYLAEGEAMED